MGEMAIFKKDEPQQMPKPRERAPLPQRAISGDAAISIIGQGMTVVGDVTTEGVVRVEGQVQGTVQAGKAVILGQAGFVDGNVLTEDAVIGGTVSGSIIANNRVELQSTCTVRGEIRTRAEHLKLEEGARFAGQIQIIDEESPRDVPVSTQRETKAASVGAKSTNGGNAAAAGAAQKNVAASAGANATPESAGSQPDAEQQKQPAEAGR
jgi:cytoskeletal protein CcmA (bactofilin family)